jgi:hypothetical protein
MVEEQLRLVDDLKLTTVLNLKDGFELRSVVELTDDFAYWVLANPLTGYKHQLCTPHNSPDHASISFSIQPCYVASSQIRIQPTCKQHPHTQSPASPSLNRIPWVCQISYTLCITSCIL